MPGQTIHFNADTRRAEREKSTITIGGRKFRPVQRTVALMDEMATQVPEAFSGVNLEDREKDPTKELHALNKQIAFLIVDQETSEKPDIEFLNSELDIEDAYALLDALSPSADNIRARD